MNIPKVGFSGLPRNTTLQDVASTALKNAVNAGPAGQAAPAASVFEPEDPFPVKVRTADPGRVQGGAASLQNRINGYLPAKVSSDPMTEFQEKMAKEAVPYQAMGKEKYHELDGMILSPDGLARPNTQPHEYVPAFKPANGAHEGDVIYTNGILVGPKRAAQEAQRISDATNGHVRVSYNDSNGLVPDLMEALGNKLDGPAENNVISLAAAMLGAVEHGKKATFMGHSEGAQQAGHAASIVLKILKEKYPDASQEQIEKMMHDNVHIITLGGSAGHYPDGPEYDHWLYNGDPVAKLAGLSSPMPTHAGKGAHIHRFGGKLDREDEGGAEPGEPNLADYLTAMANQKWHGIFNVYGAALQAYHDALAAKGGVAKDAVIEEPDGKKVPLEEKEEDIEK